jgi:hypothetical protein
MFFAGILITLAVAGNSDAIVSGKILLMHRTKAKSCLELIHFFNTSELSAPGNCLSYIYPDPEDIGPFILALDNLNFQHFPFLQAEDVAFISQAETMYGSFDVPSPSLSHSIPEGAQRLLLSGWAIFPVQKQGAKDIFVSYDDKLFLPIGPATGLPRPDVAAAIGSPEALHSGWQMEVSLSSLSPGTHVLKAWIYDRENARFLQLNGEVEIQIQA